MSSSVADVSSAVFSKVGFAAGTGSEKSESTSSAAKRGGLKKGGTQNLAGGAARVKAISTDVDVSEAVASGADVEFVRKKKKGDSKSRGSFFGMKSSGPTHDVVVKAKQKPTNADAETQTDFNADEISSMEQEIMQLREALEAERDKAEMSRKMQVQEEKQRRQREQEMTESQQKKSPGHDEYDEKGPGRQGQDEKRCRKKDKGLTKKGRERQSCSRLCSPRLPDRSFRAESDVHDRSEMALPDRAKSSSRSFS